MEVKDTSLYKLFLRYLAEFFLFTIIWFIVLVAIFGVGLWSGFILPANYGEWAIEQMEEKIAQSEEFDETLIPYPCTYVLVDIEGNILSSNMTEKESGKAQEAVKNTNLYSKERYLVIERKDSFCIVNYDMYVHFASPVINKWLPYPEVLMVILFFTGFLAIAVIIAVLFGRKLKKELVPIIEATDSIRKQELQLYFKATKIREFNTVLNSIKDMKKALEKSLKRQWSMEQNRKMQISAITHDIKTPLTIIKGNAELLQESKLLPEDKELLQYILISSNKIEKYIELLMETAKAESNDEIKKENFSVNECILEIEMQTKAYCKAQNITLFTKKENLPDSFYGDEELIIRAVSNILDNAVEYTPMQGQIEFTITGSEDKLVFRVADSGNGFSEKNLHCATEQFYTECEERSGKHYGLGLFIAKSVAIRHNGELLIENRQDGSGAVVTLIVAGRTI